MNKFNTLALFLVLLFAVGGAFAQEDGDAVEKGVEFYNAGEYQKAIETLEKVTQETGKNNRKAWLYLGMSEMRINEGAKAVKAFQKADRIAEEKDVPPDAGATKAKLTEKPRPSYTDAARQNGTQGKIKLAIEFGADGKIKQIAAFETLPDGLTQSCIGAAKKIKFEPAMKDGKPYSTIGIVFYTFTIY